MRRGSLAVPLVVILIGALFLINNLYPGFSAFDIVGRYWPFLLVGWGLFRIAEILYTYSRNKPLPLIGVTGGEWMLAVFLVIVGGGIWGVHRFSTHFPAGRVTMRGLEMFGEAFDYPVSASAPVGTAKRVVIENLRGNVRVVAGDVEEVKVAGRKTVRAFNEQDARQMSGRIPVEVLSQDGQVLVRTNQERATRDVRVSADLDITVPRAFTVECRGRYGDFDINGVLGDVDVNSDNAGVRVQDIGGNVRIDLRRSDIVRGVNIKGNVEIKGRGDDLELENVEGQAIILASYGGELQFRNMAKPVRYESATSNLSMERIPGYLQFTRGELTGDKIVGPVRITSRNKDIRLSDFSESLEVEVERGDIELRPGRVPIPKMQIRTRSGDIELAIPGEAALELDAVTDRGEIDNDFNSSLTADSSGRSASLKGKVGDGPRVALRSHGGRITIRKAAAGDAGWEIEPSRAPKPPKPPRVRPLTRLPETQQLLTHPIVQ